jgi:hypothetical protein
MNAARCVVAASIARYARHEGNLLPDQLEFGERLLN